MRKSIFSVLLSVALCAVFPGAYAAPLKVLSATPKGALSEPGRQAVQITFNQPVAALSESNSFSSSNCPLALTPSVRGSCRYAGTQTLVFEPAENWPTATSFTASVNAGFTSEVSGSKLAAPYRFSFSTPRPYVRAVYPREGEHWVSLSPTLYAAFSLPMAEGHLAQQAYLAGPGGQKIPLSVRFVTPEELDKQFSYLPGVQYVLALTPRQPLQKGTDYTLVLPAGLRAAQGTLGLEKEYKSTFTTYPELHVLGTKQDGCLPYMPQVRFSSPVRLRDVVAAVKVSPQSAVKKLSDYELDALGYEVVLEPFAKLSDSARQNAQDNYNLSAREQQAGTAFFAANLSFLQLAPGQAVTVTLDKNLTDIYGGKLGRDYAFTVSNSGYCPAVEFAGGFGVLESYLPARFPVDVINTPSLAVRAARFNKENYIPFLVQKDVSYCAQKPLSDPTFNGDYVFKDVKDKTLKTYFDLTRFRPTAQDSIVFSQVKINRGTKQEPCWVSATDNLTDVGIAFKTSPENILLWATSLQTGEPLANLTVELRDKTNTILWSGSTDMHGLARAPGWNRLDTPLPDWGTPVLYAFVSSAGGDGFISTELSNGLEPWRFNISYTYSPQREQDRTFLFTERGIYRPGETVYLKGISRHLTNHVWSVPQQMSGSLTVYDATGQDVFNQTVTASADMGTFDVSFPVPAAAHTGTWQASFTPQLKDQQDPVSAQVSFQVETAKPAEFTLTLQPEKSHYLAGEDARFTAAAHYQFGSALAQAPAQWNLRREMAWFEPEDYKGYIFVPYFLREDEYKENGNLVAGSSGKTDDQGAFSFTARLPQITTPTNIFAQVGVQSPARQDLFSRTSVMLHPASFYLGAKLPEGYAQVNKPFTVEVVAVTPQGKRTQAGHVTAQIRKEQWRSVRKVGLSGRLEWVSEKEVTPFPSQTFSVEEKGSTFVFTPTQSGNYYITFVSADEAGRTVQGGFDVMVYGKDGPSWAQQDDDILPLKPNKNTYRPGQTARINVQSPYENALALVTVEREGILDAWTTAIKGGADYVDVPIKENYLPNVYVSVMLVKGRSAGAVSADGVDLGKPQGKVGYAALQVEPESKKLTVDIRAEKTNYRPGEQVRVKLATKRGRKGVPAEVTVYAVDEGVLALTDYKTPDVFQEFYGMRPLSVFTADNRAYVVGQRNFGEKGENRGGGGSALAKLGGVDLRSRFSFVPYFSARVKTNDKGRAEVSFTLPDNLTRFRLMAVAVREQEFGSAQTQISVSKPLMITANLPKIAHAGDEFSCSAVVYNYEDKKGEMTVYAAAEGALKLADIAAKTVTVPLGQAQEVSWPCRAEQPGSARVAFSVRSRKETDGVKAEVQVLPVEQRQTLTVYGSTATTREELLDQPGNLNPSAHNRVEVSLAATALLNVKGALSYLMAYPYDCLEQQMSKIQPAITGAALVQDFNLADLATLKKQAQATLDNLAHYQHPSGGFGYWPGTLPDPYVTAYALETAYRARKAGFTVPEKTLEQAAVWLEKAFQQHAVRAFDYTAVETQTARAYSLYVLSLYGKPVEAGFNNFYSQRSTLALPAVAYLLKTAQQLNRSNAVKQALAQRVLNHITYTPKYAYFTTGQEMPWLHSTDVSASALALDALLATGQPFADAFKTVSWLLTQLNAQGYWNSTHENAQVLQALVQYYRTAEVQTPDFTVQTFWNGVAGKSVRFQGRSLTEQTDSLPFTAVYANDTLARVKFLKSGSGTVYYTLSQTYEPKAYTTPVNAGFEVSRRFTTLDGKEVSQLQAGQRYYVTVSVRSPAARHFAVAEDFIPAGVEIVNTSLATEAALPQEQDAPSPFVRVERYDERIAAFAPYLPAGTHTFTYMVSAVSRGTFAYPSAWASLMYDPAVFGRNTTTKLVIR